LRFLGETKRAGFETEFVLEDEVESVRAEAVGKDGRVLRSTGVVKAEVEVFRFKGKAEEGRMTYGKDVSWLGKVWGFLRKQEI